MIQLKDYDCVIEPSAGSGSFSKRIPNVFAYDLVPEDDSIQQADWLELDKTVFSSYKKPLIIGNPLFGRQGSLAKKFLKESMTFAHTVAFILPKGFKKDSIKNTLPLNYSVATEMDLPPNSFTLNNKEYSVPCVFQIWIKHSGYNLRERSKKKLNSNLISFTNQEEADIRIQRVGGTAGRASIDLKGSRSSNYFIKNISSYSNNDLVAIVNSISFPSINDTTGPRSLPKGELVEELDKFIG